METAKIFLNGRSQAVRLPKEYRFSDEEVGIKKVGDIVLLFPKNTVWETFLRTNTISDDFAESIIEARKDDLDNPRQPL